MKIKSPKKVMTTLLKVARMVVAIAKDSEAKNLVLALIDALITVVDELDDQED